MYFVILSSVFVRFVALMWNCPFVGVYCDFVFVLLLFAYVRIFLALCV